MRKMWDLWKKEYFAATSVMDEIPKYRNLSKTFVSIFHMT